ncbi:hypothetical protein Nocox_16265 [Nonomuraea coxensis DSM 45129]|uniref:WXG100 family type VII secretion target n=1 Tax=Nonomuraea coxensis DSM 45129 TaxID=1122611 RepID=A0ABX8TZF5_9ACTN|nr:hypothetical protein [Nonomuraea coxensis]QYC40867.1 hypothetical protein Nocox_16265 [Nonomuraea coxensis DSM 45129]
MSSGSDELKVPSQRPDQRDDDVRARDAYERGYEDEAGTGDVRVAGTATGPRRDVLDDRPDRTGHDHTSTDHTGTDHTGTDHLDPDHTGGFDDPERRDVHEDERVHPVETRDSLDGDHRTGDVIDGDDGDDEFARSEQTTVPSPPPHTGSTETAHTTGAVPAETPAHAAPADTALFDQDPAEVQSRWRDLQAAFVDDPGDAVQRADGLLSEVVESLTAGLNSRTSALRERWKDAGTPDTEQLRQALREYRSVLERLLAVSSTSDARPETTAGAIGAHTSAYGSPGQAAPTITDEVR